MIFELISNKEKAAKPPKARIERFDFKAIEGSTVCYHQPLYQAPLSRLQSAIYAGVSLRALKGRYYKIQSNGGYLHLHYPAGEYYKIAFRMMRNNVHTIRLAKGEVQNYQAAIEDIYYTRKEILPNGQAKLSFDKEIYQLRANLTTYIFSVRATLDTISSIFPTIYGPKIGQHISFNGLIKHILSGKCQIKDPVLVKFLSDEMEWFTLLKDVRDYLAHFGAINFSLKEGNCGALYIEMFRGIEVNAFVEAVDIGFSRLLKFLDEHCPNVIDSL